MNSHYKEKKPTETAAFIKGILNNANITVEDIFPEYENEGTYSLRTVVKGTATGQNGKGVSQEYAVASAYAEFMERLQNDYLFQYNYSKETNEFLGFYNFIDEKVISAREFVEQKNDFLAYFLKSTGLELLPEQDQINQIEANYRQSSLRYQADGMVAYPYYSVKHGRLFYIPSEMCTSIYLSSGMCAGNTMEEAMVQGISEIWERHIHKTVLSKGTALPEIPDSYIKENYGYVWELMKNFRENHDYTVMMKDASLGGIFPAAMLIITDRKNHSYGVRFGAHIDLGIAMERTITEALQGKRMREFTSYCKPDCSDKEVNKYYNKFNSLKVGCSNYYMQIFSSESQYQFCEPVKYNSNSEALSIYLSRIRESGYDILLRDVSYLGFPTFQIMIPGFSEVLSPDLQMARLSNTVQYVSNNIKALGSLGQKDLDFIVRLIDSKKDCIIEGDFPAFYRIPLQMDFPFNGSSNGIMVLGAFIRYAQGNYEDALQRLDQYIYKMNAVGIPVDEYLLCSREYIAAKMKNTGHEEAKKIISYFYSGDVVDKVCSDLIDGTKTLSLLYPQLNCCHCTSCTYKKDCGYQEIEKVKRTMKRKQVENPLNQMGWEEKMKTLLH